MKIQVSSIILIAFLYTFFPFVFAKPLIYNYSPKNGTYITGGAEYNFSIEVKSENFNSSSAILTVGSEEVWPNKASKLSMECNQINSTDWICSSNVLISVAESGTKEFYFFKASDKDGSTSFLGNSSEPLFVVIDRSPPIVKPILENMSYVSINKKPEFLIYDQLSGLSNQQKWMFGNETWNSSWMDLLKVRNETFEADFDTSNLANNSTWFIYLNVSDRLGNFNITRILTVIIDNEKPQIDVIYPKQNSVLIGKQTFKVSVRDNYSGINSTYFIFSPSGLTGSLSCNSTHTVVCTGDFDVNILPSGNYILKFFSVDFANNTAEKDVKVNITNKYPVINFLHPLDGSWIHGKTKFLVKVENCKSIQNGQIKFSNPVQTIGWLSMNCFNNSCEYTWDTSDVQEGEWTVTVKIQNGIGYEVKKSIRVRIDNTKPYLTVFPIKEIISTASLGLVAIDENGLNKTGAWLSIEGTNYSRKMKCNSFVGGKKLICSYEFNAKNFSSGKYTFEFHVYDLAGNEAVKEVTIPIIFKSSEEKTSSKNVSNILTEAGKLSQNNETSVKTIIVIKKVNPLHLLLLLTASTVLLIFYLLRSKKEKIPIASTFQELNDEIDAIHAIKTYIFLAININDLDKMKEYAKYINILLNRIRKKSKIKETLEKLEKIHEFSSYREKIEKIPERSRVINEMKKTLMKIFSTENLEELNSEFNKLKSQAENLEEIIEKERAIWEELSEEIKGGKNEH